METEARSRIVLTPNLKPPSDLVRQGKRPEAKCRPRIPLGYRLGERQVGGRQGRQG